MEYPKFSPVQGQEVLRVRIRENFNAKALKWICGNMNYIDSVISTNLLPPLHNKVLKDFVVQ